MMQVKKSWLSVLSALALAIALALAAPSARAAAFGPLVDKPVLAIAVAGQVVAVMVAGERGRQVITLPRDPTLPAAIEARWPDAQARAQPAPGARRHDSEVDDVLAAYDLTDADRDTPATEQLLEEEGVDEPPARRRAAETREPLAPSALAAAGSRLWMASTRGVWALEGDGVDRRWRSRGFSDRVVSLIAAAQLPDGRALVAAAIGDAVWMTDDGGARWTLAGIGATRPRALAIAPDGGAVLAAAEDGLWALGPHLPPRRLDEEGSDDVVVCAGRVVALGHGTVSRFAGGIDREPLRTGGVAARAIRCSPTDAGPWIGVAASGLISPGGGGGEWSAIGDGALEITAATVAGGEVWLGTPGGLYARVPTAGAAPPAAGTPDALESDEQALLRRPVAQAPPWLRYLPRVALLGGASAGEGRHVVYGFLLLTIPLSRRPPASGSELAAELLRRRVRAAAAARDQAQLDRSVVETIAETFHDGNETVHPAAAR